jgi:hypothetical protein
MSKLCGGISDITRVPYNKIRRRRRPFPLSLFLPLILIADSFVIHLLARIRGIHQTYFNRPR